MLAEVVKLDRGFPLVRLQDGTVARCEHSADIKKNGSIRAVVGDRVRTSKSDEHDKAIITEILPRRTELVRKDPSDRAIPQVLAANFDMVIIAQPLDGLNLRRLERELVLAHETGVSVLIVLTKADLVDGRSASAALEKVGRLAGASVQVLCISPDDADGLERIRMCIGADKTAVLIGRSGVGKSSLINLLAGKNLRSTQSVRSGDGKGRHTTINREIIDLPCGGRVVDMPGVRGVGMWESEAGIGRAFSDVEEFAGQCRFRDCRHEGEPGCAVREAVEAGKLPQERVDSYCALKEETQTARRRKEESRWKKH